VAQKFAAKLIGAGLAKEIKAKAGTPVWRRYEQIGESYALKLTAAGARAIAVDDGSASDETREDCGERVQVAAPNSEVVQQATADVPTANAPSPSAPRDGTKLGQVLELLQRGRGATLNELVVMTGWLPHTTRAALTGIRKRGYSVTIDRSDKERGSTYHARLDETVEAGQAAAQSDDPPVIPAISKRKKAERANKFKAQQAA
jgi:hypothetical protein